MAYTKQAARQQFERWSDRYDRSILQRLFFQPSHHALLEHVRVAAGSRVLEIGCGTGNLAGRLAARQPQCELWGLDLSRAMLEHAVRRMGDALLPAEGDAERLPFADDCFDVVLCAHSFHHFPQQARAIEEMHRVLRPGGQAWVLDGNRDPIWGRLIYDVGVVAFEGDVHHASAERFRRLFREAGFTAIEQHRGGRLAPFLITGGIAGKTQSRTGAKRGGEPPGLSRRG